MTHYHHRISITKVTFSLAKQSNIPQFQSLKKNASSKILLRGTRINLVIHRSPDLIMITLSLVFYMNDDFKIVHVKHSKEHLKQAVILSQAGLLPRWKLLPIILRHAKRFLKICIAKIHFKSCRVNIFRQRSLK